MRRVSELEVYARRAWLILLKETGRSFQVVVKYYVADPLRVTVEDGPFAKRREFMERFRNVFGEAVWAVFRRAMRSVVERYGLPKDTLSYFLVEEGPRSYRP